MIEPPEENRIRSIIHASVDAVPGVVLESLLLKLPLSGFEISAKLLDEGFESCRIQQVLHGRLAGFEFLVGYGEHGGGLLWMFVRSEKESRESRQTVFRCVYLVFRRGLNTVEISI